MLTEERKETILRLLSQQAIVKSQDLSSLLNASESTIRRDLQDLEDEGLLERIHGGAKRILHLEHEQDMTEKSAKNVQKKQMIAKYAASLVHENDIIYLDAGSTTFEMIPFLAGKSVKVVTNSVYHAASLADYQIATIILGGTIKLSTKAVLGASTSDQLRQFRFNRCFMGSNGVHSQFGFTTPDPEEAALKTLAMTHSEAAYILVDDSKFGQISFTKIADIKDATIITNQNSYEFLAELKDQTTIKEVAE